MALLFSSGIDRHVLSSVGIRSYKKTHINCGSSARMADVVCASEDQIRRQGRWNSTSKNDVYLTSVPREMMQSMAGFPTNGRFSSARAALDPSTSLYKKFPAIDERHDRLSAKELSPDSNDLIQPNVAANAYIQVIMMPMKTFIQDSALMMELRP
jgi:hypothetical protein